MKLTSHHWNSKLNLKTYKVYTVGTKMQLRYLISNGPEKEGSSQQLRLRKAVMAWKVLLRFYLLFHPYVYLIVISSLLFPPFLFLLYLVSSNFWALQIFGYILYFCFVSKKLTSVMADPLRLLCLQHSYRASFLYCFLSRLFGFIRRFKFLRCCHAILRRIWGRPYCLSRRGYIRRYSSR